MLMQVRWGGNTATLRINPGIDVVCDIAARNPSDRTHRQAKFLIAFQHLKREFINRQVTTVSQSSPSKNTKLANNQRYNCRIVPTAVKTFLLVDVYAASLQIDEPHRQIRPWVPLRRITQTFIKTHPQIFYIFQANSMLICAMHVIAAHAGAWTKVTVLSRNPPKITITSYCCRHVLSVDIVCQNKTSVLYLRTVKKAVGCKGVRFHCSRASCYNQSAVKSPEWTNTRHYCRSLIPYNKCSSTTSTQQEGLSQRSWWYSRAEKSSKKKPSSNKNRRKSKTQYN